MRVVCARLIVSSFAVVAGHGHCQSFYYVEPGVTACPAAPVQSTAAPKTVPLGVPVPGRIRVSCGFDNGSYTVTLNASDPGATFSPKTFIVNFGRVVGNGVFAVKFSTVGLQRVTTTITANMGSPALSGQFVSPDNAFKVVHRRASSATAAVSGGCENC
jgi:hypothetical protein